MLKAELVELLADTYHGGEFDQPGGREMAKKILNKLPKYILSARAECLTAPIGPAKEAAREGSKAAYERSVRIGRGRGMRR